VLVIAPFLIGLSLWLCGLATGVTLGRRRAYRNAARSVWPFTTTPEGRIVVPAATLPAASRRALRRHQRANRADLQKALRR
jgi:hypothetical protein